MLIAALIGVILISFAGVLFFGAPYLPTLTPQVEIALKLANLKKGHTLLELGCGDGKVLIAAAKQGYKVVGYELNPILALIAWLRTRRHKSQVTVYCANFWNVTLPPAEAIFIFLLPKYMTKLEQKILLRYPGGIKVISFAFPIAGRKPTNEEQGVFLYKM